MGEVVALDTDYAELRSRLETAVRKVAPAWLADQTDDLVQQAVIKVMQRYRRGQTEANMAFLYRVAHSCVVDEIRRVRRRSEEGMAPDAEPAARVGADPEKSVHGMEISRAILDCLGHLSVPRRRAVTLHLQGHSVPEAGRLLGFNAKKAENLIYRGIADLRRCLGTKGLEP